MPRDRIEGRAALKATAFESSVWAEMAVIADNKKGQEESISQHVCASSVQFSGQLLCDVPPDFHRRRHKSTKREFTIEPLHFRDIAIADRAIRGGEEQHNRPRSGRRKPIDGTASEIDTEGLRRKRRGRTTDKQNDPREQRHLCHGSTMEFSDGNSWIAQSIHTPGYSWLTSSQGAKRIRAVCSFRSRRLDNDYSVCLHSLPQSGSQLLSPAAFFPQLPAVERLPQAAFRTLTHPQQR